MTVLQRGKAVLDVEAGRTDAAALARAMIGEGAAERDLAAATDRVEVTQGPSARGGHCAW